MRKVETKVQLHLTRLRFDASVASKCQKISSVVSSCHDLLSLHHFANVRIEVSFIAKQRAQIQALSFPNILGNYIEEYNVVFFSSFLQSTSCVILTEFRITYYGVSRQAR